MKSVKTRVYRLTGETSDRPAVEEAGRVIRLGGLVAFPTETVYGLGANALDAGAVQRIFEAKGRPSADPLIVHVARVEDIPPLVSRIPDSLALLRGYWPGPLTIVLPKSSLVPPEITAGLDTVAIRIPAHPIALALLESAGGPIAAPSANRFTRPSPTCAEHVLEDLEDRFELLLDGGPTQHGLESTILDLSCDVPTLLRPGAITIESLRDCLPKIEAPAPVMANLEAGALRTPGSHVKHYSPKARVRIFDGPDRAVVETRLIDEINSMLRQGLRVGVMHSNEGLARLAAFPVVQASLGADGDLKSAGNRLFAALRELDASRVDVIVTESFPLEGLGRTLQDRLSRAAEGRVEWVEGFEH